MTPSRRRRSILIEAAVALVLARMAVRMLPAQRLLERARQPPPRPQRFADPDFPAYAAKAVREVASWPWVNAVCLPQALALQGILRRRGIASNLCVGVARDGDSLAAHAWVEIDRRVIIGQSERRFVGLAQFG